MAPTADRSPSLQDNERFALMKFRRAVADIVKPHHDDYFLLRWLNARNWNPEAAEKMLRDSMKWRERLGVDDIDKWPTPRAQQELSPHGLSGFDKGGSPIIIIPFAGLDIIGQLHAVSRADYIRGTVKNLEMYMNIGLEQSKLHGPGARQFVILFDMKDYNMRQYTWRPAGEVIIALIKTYEANYPEILKSCYLINVPKVFLFVFNIIKKFLNEHTISKICLYKAGSQKWLPKLLDHCDPSQLPAYFGGTQTDPDGNPKCVTKINYGGKVPEAWYLTNCAVGDNPNAIAAEDFTEATIKKGGRLRLEFKCTEPDRVLRWEFSTVDHDIRFGVKFVDNSTGEETAEVELGRVASHQLDEVGFIACQVNCTYVVLFDNSYSYFTTKRIRYAVQMVENVIGGDEAELNADKFATAEAAEVAGQLV